MKNTIELNDLNGRGWELANAPDATDTMIWWARPAGSKASFAECSSSLEEALHDELTRMSDEDIKIWFGE